MPDAYAAPVCAVSRPFGVLIDVEDPAWTEGQDVKAHYGITKYIPPLKTTAGDAAPPHPLFVEYTDIENLRNFPDMFWKRAKKSLSPRRFTAAWLTIPTLQWQMAQPSVL